MMVQSYHKIKLKLIVKTSDDLSEVNLLLQGFACACSEFTCEIHDLLQYQMMLHIIERAKEYLLDLFYGKYRMFSIALFIHVKNRNHYTINIE